jgi:hypothetical protein
LGDPRFTSSGLSIADADAFLPHLAKFVSRPRTGAEVEDLLKARLGEGKRGVWWALRTFAPLHHVPTGGPWSFDAPSSFFAARTKLGPESADESVQWLVLRYLQAFGPASVQDFAQFTMLRRSVVRQALQALAGKVEELEVRTGQCCSMCPGHRFRQRTPLRRRGCCPCGTAFCSPTPIAAALFRRTIAR